MWHALLSDAGPTQTRRLECPDLDRRVASDRDEVLVHVPQALRRTGVAVREKRGMLHTCAVIDLHNHVSINLIQHENHYKP